MGIQKLALILAAGLFAMAQGAEAQLDNGVPTVNLVGRSGRVARGGDKSCEYQGKTFKQGESFFDPSVKCHIATCYCDPKGSGVATCGKCPVKKEGGCEYKGNYYAPGENFVEPGTYCFITTCTCKDKKVSCGKCPARTNKGICNYMGKSYNPGDKFVKPGTECSQPTCTCSAGRSGNVTCKECPDK